MDALFALGSNGSGQLGIGHKEDVSVPKPVQFHPSPPEHPIARIAAGGNHTLLLTAAGQLFWSGSPDSGACGVASAPSVPVFQEVQLSKEGNNAVGPCVLVAATWEASFVLARDGAGRNTRVYSLGAGTKGELGAGELMVRTPTATLLRDFPPAGTEVVDLHASMGHAVAVLDNGDAYGWGNGRKGQLGEPAAVVHAPRKLEGVGFHVRRAVCCKESTCLLGGAGNSELLVLGSDKWSIRSRAPERAPPLRDIGASWGNVYILTAEGGLLAWGRDDHGQLPPPGLPPLASIAVGSEHVVALTRAGDVLSWGWGEHGNCGPQVENNNVKGRWNVIASSKFIPKEARISAIGAGCATSWVYISTG